LMISAWGDLIRIDLGFDHVLIQLNQLINLFTVTTSLEESSINNF
jgi:hypothetical protein